MIELVCRACRAHFDVERRDLLAGPVTHCPACRTPKAACTVAWSERGRYWAITIPRCPLCGGKHHHGGGTDPGGPDLGHRASHCLDRSGSYELVETPARIEERARTPAKAVAA